MKTSARGRAFIEAWEGKFNSAYDDGTGVLTIGYGHTSRAGPPKVFDGMWICDRECDAILAADLARVELEVMSCIDGLAQWQFDALVSFHFNTGALIKSSIPSKIEAGDQAAAMATLMQYTHAGGVEMAGLVKRRMAERWMFNGQITQAMELAQRHSGIMPQAPHAPGAESKSVFEKFISFLTKAR